MCIDIKSGLIGFFVAVIAILTLAATHTKIEREGPRCQISTGNNSTWVTDSYTGYTYQYRGEKTGWKWSGNLVHLILVKNTETSLGIQRA